MNRKLLLIITALIASGCAINQPTPEAEPVPPELPEFQIVFDAGSEGTDIFVYEAGNWKKVIRLSGLLCQRREKLTQAIC